MPEIRSLRPDEHRASAELFLGTLHLQVPDDSRWEELAAEYVPGRTYGAFDAGEQIGCAGSLPSALCVPGGAWLSMAAVTNVGVRADHTRKGVLRAMMRAQLDGCAAAGEPIAALRATESGIYGRFGYGIATRQVTFAVQAANARAVNPGTVRMLAADEARKRLPALHDAVAPERAGAIRRPPGWWAVRLAMLRHEGQFNTVVHRNASGEEDGYALYNVHHQDRRNRRMELQELWGADRAARVDLWRYVASVDLVGEVEARKRPIDEQIDLVFDDPRAAAITDSGDETWLRLVDVLAALRARTYGAETVVLGVGDDFLPGNTGNYRVGADGVARVAEDAELYCDVATLAMLYLGDRTAAALAAAGRLHGDAEALRRAETVFATAEVPWCGTQF